MPSKEAERYLRQEWAKTQYLHRQFCLEVRSYQIKYYLFFAAYVLILVLLAGNAYGARIIENLFIIGSFGLIGPICFWAGVFYWTKYRDLNG